MARLDAYFDPNERKYYITPQSVELAIAEEKAKVARSPERFEAIGSVSKGAEDISERTQPSDNRIKGLEKEVLDLKITNRGKDYLIEQFQNERQSQVEQLMQSSRKVGELETKLLRLSEAAGERPQLSEDASGSSR